MLGFDNAKGDAIVVMMADESDDCRDVARYWQALIWGVPTVSGAQIDCAYSPRGVR